MNELYLKFPTMEDKKNVMEYKKEFEKSGQRMSGSGGLDRFETYEEWLAKISNDTKEETCGDGRVPSILYLTYRKEDKKLIGMVQIRQYLNEYLFNYGGNIGDSIRPTEQSKGYGTEQISLALGKCKELGINKVLITCTKNNIASAKTIIKNNGCLENEIADKEGSTFQRFWIELDNMKKEQ